MSVSVRIAMTGSPSLKRQTKPSTVLYSMRPSRRPSISLIPLVNYNHPSINLTPTPKHYQLSRRGILFSRPPNLFATYLISCSRHPLSHLLRPPCPPFHLYRTLYFLRASPRVCCSRRFQCRCLPDAFITLTFVYPCQSWSHSCSLLIPASLVSTSVKSLYIIVHHAIYHNNLR